MTRVLVVDDSRIFRGEIARALADIGDYEVVGSEFNGQRALEFLDRHPVDVMTLDLAMPGMSGFEVLDRIQERTWPSGRPAVIVVSAHGRDEMAGAIRALEHGALGFVAKPTSSDAVTNQRELREALAEQMLAATYAGRRGLRSSRSPPAPIALRNRGRAVVGNAEAPPLIAIGASTGGPQALATLLPRLTVATDAPIVLVQHMPAGFTASLARSLARRCPRYQVAEAEDGAEILARSLTVARGGCHLALVEREGRIRCRVEAGPPVNGCCPSVDTLFASLVDLRLAWPVPVILTGMGSDGSGPLRRLAERGCRILIQDEASSVVWGMPGRAAATGCVSGIHPLDELADAIVAERSPA